MDIGILDAIRNRRATRDFTGRAVDESTVRVLLDAAVQAPSARNLQPWSFVVIQDPALLQRISDAAKQLLHADLHWQGSAPFTDPAFNIFYNATTLIVICAAPDGFSPVGDCYLAGATLMLAAHGLGLATCPIGFARGALQAPAMKQQLGIPPEWQPVLPIIVGYPKGTAPKHGRQPPVIQRWIKPGNQVAAAKS